jgi:hypothetical protein
VSNTGNQQALPRQVRVLQKCRQHWRHSSVHGSSHLFNKFIYLLHLSKLDPLAAEEKVSHIDYLLKLLLIFPLVSVHLCRGDGPAQRQGSGRGNVEEGKQGNVRARWPGQAAGGSGRPWRKGSRQHIEPTNTLKFTLKLPTFPKRLTDQINLMKRADPILFYFHICLVVS